MAEEPKKQLQEATIQKRNLDVSLILKDEEKAMRLIDPIVTKAILNREERDFRATMVHREEMGQAPDVMTTMLDFDDTKVSRRGFNRALDIKGNITPNQQYMNRMARTLTMLGDLDDWEFIKVWDDDKDEWVNEPVNLPMEAMEEDRWLSLAVNGTQARAQMAHARAISGVPEENFGEKVGMFLGAVRKRKKDVFPDREE